MKINGKSTQGIFIYSENYEYERGDFVIYNDTLYRCIAEQDEVVCNSKPSEDNKNFEEYPGNKIRRKEDYVKELKNGLSNSYVSSDLLNRVLSDMYFGMNESGLIDSEISYTDGKVSYDVKDIKGDYKYGESQSILDTIIKGEGLNNGAIKVSAGLPEIENILPPKSVSAKFESYYLAGTVIDSGTGKGVGGTIIRDVVYDLLNSSADIYKKSETSTDETGSFVIPISTDTSRIEIVGPKRGKYISKYFDLSDAISYSYDKETHTITIKDPIAIQKEGVFYTVSGKVIDFENNALEGITVSADNSDCSWVKVNYDKPLSITEETGILDSFINCTYHDADTENNIAEVKYFKTALGDKDRDALRKSIKENFLYRDASKNYGVFTFDKGNMGNINTNSFSVSSSELSSFKTSDMNSGTIEKTFKISNDTFTIPKGAHILRLDNKTQFEISLVNLIDDLNLNGYFSGYEVSLGLFAADTLKDENKGKSGYIGDSYIEELGRSEYGAIFYTWSGDNIRNLSGLSIDQISATEVGKYLDKDVVCNIALSIKLTGGTNLSDVVSSTEEASIYVSADSPVVIKTLTAKVKTTTSGQNWVFTMVPALYKTSCDWMDVGFGKTAIWNLSASPDNSVGINLSGSSYRINSTLTELAIVPHFTATLLSQNFITDKVESFIVKLFLTDGNNQSQIALYDSTTDSWSYQTATVTSGNTYRLSATVEATFKESMLNRGNLGFSIALSNKKDPQDSLVLSKVSSSEIIVSEDEDTKSTVGFGGFIGYLKQSGYAFEYGNSTSTVQTKTDSEGCYTLTSQYPILGIRLEDVGSFREEDYRKRSMYEKVSTDYVVSKMYSRLPDQVKLKFPCPGTLFISNYKDGLSYSRFTSEDSTGNDYIKQLEISTVTDSPVSLNELLEQTGRPSLYDEILYLSYFPSEDEYCSLVNSSIIQRSSALIGEYEEFILNVPLTKTSENSSNNVINFYDSGNNIKGLLLVSKYFNYSEAPIINTGDTLSITIGQSFYPEDQKLIAVANKGYCGKIFNITSTDEADYVVPLDTESYRYRETETDLNRKSGYVVLRQFTYKDDRTSGSQGFFTRVQEIIDPQYGNIVYRYVNTPGEELDFKNSNISSWISATNGNLSSREKLNSLENLYTRRCNELEQEKKSLQENYCTSIISLGSNSSTSFSIGRDNYSELNDSTMIITLLIKKNIRGSLYRTFTTTIGVSTSAESEQEEYIFGPQEDIDKLIVKKTSESVNIGLTSNYPGCIHCVYYKKKFK